MAYTIDDIGLLLKQLEKNQEESLAKIDKAASSKLNKLYNIVVKLFSIGVLAATVYTAVIGFAGSAIVLALLFLTTWFMSIIGQVIIEVVRAKTVVTFNEVQAQYDKLDKDKYRFTNSRP